MSPRPRFLGLLAGIGLLIAAPRPGHAQGLFPTGPDGQPLTVPLVEDPSGLASSPLQESAPPPSPWYADGEFAVLFNGAVHFNEQFGVVEENNAVYVSPRVYLGRRLAGGGSVRFTYRNLTEVGRLEDSDEWGGNWSRDRTFTTNWFDLDYVTRDFAPLPWWRVRAEAGGRLVYRHHSLRDQSPYARYDIGLNYFGGGPHLGLTSQLLLGRSGLVLYGRADTAVTFGGGTATYDYRPQQSDPWGWDVPRSERQSLDQCQFDLGLQLGLVRRWEWRGRTVGLGAGVQADVLTVGEEGGGRFDTSGLVNVGPFLRFEVGF